MVRILAWGILCSVCEAQLPREGTGPGLAVQMTLKNCEPGDAPRVSSRRISIQSATLDPWVRIYQQDRTRYEVSVSGEVAAISVLDGGAVSVCGKDKYGHGYVDIIRPNRAGIVSRCGYQAFDMPVIAAFYSWIECRLYIQERGGRMYVAPVVVSEEGVYIDWAGGQRLDLSGQAKAREAVLSPGGDMRLGFLLTAPGALFKARLDAGNVVADAVSPQIAFSRNCYVEAITACEVLRMNPGESQSGKAVSCSVMEVGTGRRFGRLDGSDEVEHVSAGRMYLSSHKPDVVCPTYLAQDGWAERTWLPPSIHAARALGAHLLHWRLNKDGEDNELVWIFSSSIGGSPRIESGILVAQQEFGGEEWLGGGIAFWAPGKPGSRVWGQALSLRHGVVVGASEIVGIDVGRAREGGLADVVLTDSLAEVAFVHGDLPIAPGFVERWAKIRAASASNTPRGR